MKSKKARIQQLNKIKEENEISNLIKTAQEISATKNTNIGDEIFKLLVDQVSDQIIDDMLDENKNHPKS